MKKVFLTGLLICSVLSAQGCILLTGAAVGGTATAYKLGKLKHNIDEDVERVHKASLKALENLDWYVASESILLNSSRIEAQTIEGKKVKIEILALTERASQISIRIGTVGSEQRSFMLLGSIQKQL